MMKTYERLKLTEQTPDTYGHGHIAVLVTKEAIDSGVMRCRLAVPNYIWNSGKVDTYYDLKYGDIVIYFDGVQINMDVKSNNFISRNSITNFCRWPYNHPTQRSIYFLNAFSISKKMHHTAYYNCQEFLEFVENNFELVDGPLNSKGYYVDFDMFPSDCPWIVKDLLDPAKYRALIMKIVCELEEDKFSYVNFIGNEKHFNLQK